MAVQGVKKIQGYEQGNGNQLSESSAEQDFKHSFLNKSNCD